MTHSYVTQLVMVIWKLCSDSFYNVFNIILILRLLFAVNYIIHFENVDASKSKFKRVIE
jgi:hypothetical protein